MSETARSYTIASKKAGRRRRRRFASASRAVAFLFVGVAAVLLWMTRDSHELWRFLPSGQKVYVLASNPLATREELQFSRVWGAFPTPVVNEWRDRLSWEPSVPSWLLRHVLREQLVVTSASLDRGGDALITARMSRLGALITRMLPLLPQVERDHAGGLGLLRLDNPELYLAVRGRVLLASFSRDTLIRALTLTTGDTMDRRLYEDLAQGAGGSVRGALTLDPDDLLGSGFKSVQFALEVNAERASLASRFQIRDSARARFGPLLNGVTPQTLQPPPDGAVEISLDVGKPVREIWPSLGQALQIDWLSAAQWQEWERLDPPRRGARPDTAHLLTDLLGPLGPGVRLSCTKIDPNELIPFPRLAGTIDADAPALRTKLAGWPEPPPEAGPRDSFPRVDAEAGLMFLPVPGSPSIEPVGKIENSMFWIATDRATLEDAIKAGKSNRDLPQANLYVRVVPKLIINDLIESARLLAESGLLNGHTPASFEETAATWSRAAQTLREAELAVSVKQDVIELTLTLDCASTRAGTASASQRPRSG